MVYIFYIRLFGGFKPVYSFFVFFEFSIIRFYNRILYFFYHKASTYFLVNPCFSFFNFCIIAAS